MKHIVQLSVGLFLLFWGIMPQKSAAQSRRELPWCFRQEIRCTSALEEKNRKTLLIVNYKDDSIAVFYHSAWYLLGEDESVCLGTSDINPDLHGGMWNIVVSKNQKYLAGVYVTEGHPLLYIYDLQELVCNQKIKMVQEINPYPGTIELLGWTANGLEINSSVRLTDLNGKTEFTACQLLDQNKKYKYKVEQNQFSE